MMGGRQEKAGEKIAIPFVVVTKLPFKPEFNTLDTKPATKPRLLLDFPSVFDSAEQDQHYTENMGVSVV